LNNHVSKAQYLLITIHPPDICHEDGPVGVADDLVGDVVQQQALRPAVTCAKMTR